MREIIRTEKAPAAIGAYSQAIAASGKLVFTAGQIPIDNKTGKIVAADISLQTHTAIQNLLAVLNKAGATVANVAKTTVYLKDMEMFAQFNKVYSEYFGESLPARSAIEAARLPKDVLIEIDAIAVL